MVRPMPRLMSHLAFWRRQSHCALKMRPRQEAAIERQGGDFFAFPPLPFKGQKNTTRFLTWAQAAIYWIFLCRLCEFHIKKPDVKNLLMEQEVVYP